MSINLGVAETAVSYLKPRIAVVGVGGGGGNAVNNMIAQNLEGVDFIVANTDAQALAHSAATNKIQLGLEITQGLGAGARPEIGKMAAEEAKDKIAEALDGVNMVFITAGMGGGTGSGAAPVVAHIAKEKGILTVGVVTKPFSFEGKKRMEIADQSLENFIKEVDSIIVIPNQNLFRIADENTTLSEAFRLADNVLYSGVRSITDLMMMPGLINLDFADVKNIMEDKGKAIMGTGEAEGKGLAKDAAAQALSNPLLDDCIMKGAKGVLINITGGQDITLPELDEAANTIKEEVGDDANIIFGSSYDDNLAGKIRVSIVVTGISDGKQRPEPERRTYAGPSLIDISYDTGSSVPTVETVEVHDEAKEVKPVFLDPEADDDMIVPLDDEEPISFGNDDEEEVEVLEKDSLDDVFTTLDKSSELPEMPKATSLFKTITSNDVHEEEEAKIEKELNSVSAEDDFFSSKNSIENLVDDSDDEPVLFDNDTSIFKDTRAAEPAEEPISEPEDEGGFRPTFIERVIGIRARKKHENDAREASENVAVGDEDLDLSGDDLDIPSFLRRK